MNHNKTVNTMRNKFQSDIAYVNNSQHIPYIFGEVGSALGGSQQVDSSLGTALWTADFMLHAMTLGVAGVNMQLGNDYGIAAWQPVDTPNKPAQVHGNFYGHVFVADFIGTKGDLQVAALEELPSARHPHFVGYAGYNSGKLSKVAILNMLFWDTDSTDHRPSQNLTVVVGRDIDQVRVDRLASSLGATAFQQNITWADQRWTKETNGMPVNAGNSTAVRQVKNGTVEDVNINASEGILLTLLRST